MKSLAIGKLEGETVEVITAFNAPSPNVLSYQIQEDIFVIWELLSKGYSVTITPIDEEQDGT